MSYYRMMKRIEKRIDDKGKQTKSSEILGSGLLARSSMPTGPLSAAEDVTDEIASYIMSVRRQKEELISGKK